MSREYEIIGSYGQAGLIGFWNQSRFVSHRPRARGRDYCDCRGGAGPAQNKGAQHAEPLQALPRKGAASSAPTLGDAVRNSVRLGLLAFGIKAGSSPTGLARGKNWKDKEENE